MYQIYDYFSKSLYQMSNRGILRVKNYYPGYQFSKALMVKDIEVILHLSALAILLFLIHDDVLMADYHLIFLYLPTGREKIIWPDTKAGLAFA